MPDIEFEFKWVNDNEGMVEMHPMDYTLYINEIPIAKIGNGVWIGTIEWWILENKLSITRVISERHPMGDMAFKFCEAYVRAAFDLVKDNEMIIWRAFPNNRRKHEG